MKLLLTSAGLSNKSIIDALSLLLGKSSEGVRLAYIPTASNVEAGDKGWLIDEYNKCERAGFVVDIVDISALDRSFWEPRLKQAKVIFVGGGKTFHLKEWIDKSGLGELLPSLLQERVYVGSSAGSCVCGPQIFSSVSSFCEGSGDLVKRDGMGWIDFHFIPHFNSEYFSKINEDNIKMVGDTVEEPIYALDDESAIVINGRDFRVVSEGDWIKV